MSDTPREVVERYFAAERRLDSDAVMACFDEDAVLVGPDGTRHAGRTAIRAFYESLYTGLERLDVWTVDDVTAGASAAIEWEANVIGRDGAKHLRGVNVVATHDGLVAELRVYFTVC